MGLVSSSAATGFWRRDAYFLTFLNFRCTFICMYLYIWAEPGATLPMNVGEHNAYLELF